MIGAYYGKLMNQAKEQKRISNVPHEPSLPVSEQRSNRVRCTTGTSHAADAFRYLAMGLDHAVTRKAFSRPLVYPQLGLV